MLSLSVRCCILLLLVVSAVRADTPPNIILILADDLGAHDLGCYGSDLYETPHIDRFRQRFTCAYSACTVCSPTRAALMTGQYPARLHVTDWITGHEKPNARLRVPDWTKHLALERETLAEKLKTAGYETVHLGKWHLGETDFYPVKQGFDASIGGSRRGQPATYFFPYTRRPEDPWAVDLPGGKPGEYLTDRLTDEAIRVLRQPREKPLFMYLAHYTVHTPLEPKPELVAKYKKLIKPGLKQSNAVYAAMVESLDQSVGRILDALDQLPGGKNTIVIFTSDNGGLVPQTSNAPLRAGKGSPYEGGVRVPLLVTGKGIEYGGGNLTIPVITQDLFATICDWAGARIEETSPVAKDAISLAGWLDDTAPPVSDRALFWHYPHYHPGGATPYGAVRLGDWKLIEFYEDNRVELYNLKDDIGESKNLAGIMPEKATELRRRLHAWRDEVGSQMPTANPNFKP